MTSNSIEVAIYENYGSYKPRINAAKTVRHLLDTVQPELLRGLRSVVVSSQTALSRDQRRKKAWSRGKKIARNQILGYYHPAWKGQMAYIELYVDRICLGRLGPLVWISLIGDIAVGQVLFHEIGHHIHATARPELREREDVADEWARKLLRTAALERHRYAVAVLRPLVRAARFFRGRVKRS